MPGPVKQSLHSPDDVQERTAGGQSDALRSDSVNEALCNVFRFARLAGQDDLVVGLELPEIAEGNADGVARASSGRASASRTWESPRYRVIGPFVRHSCSGFFN